MRPSVVGQGFGISTSALDVEVGDGQVAGTNFVEEIDIGSIGASVQVMVDDRPALRLIGFLVAFGLTLVAGDGHHIGDVFALSCDALHYAE